MYKITGFAGIKVKYRFLNLFSVILALKCFKMWLNTCIFIILNVFKNIFIFHGLDFLACGVFLLSADSFWHNNRCTLVDNEIITCVKGNLNFSPLS